MRLTVGSLPPAVYWRRRAVVLGAVLLFLIVLLYSCTGTDHNTGAPGGDPSPGGSAGAAPDPSGSVLTPQSTSPSPTPGASGDTGGTNTGGGSGDGSGTGDGTGDGAGDGTNTGAGDGGTSGQSVSGDGTCTDAELRVTPVALPASAPQRTVVTLRLKIKNVSDRTCSRDVGADLQELYVKAGAEKVWSSDTCGTNRGSNVQSFASNFERSYELGWNGRDTSRCADGLAAGPYAPIGTYQVFARVGTKISEPVKLTITG
ncbi:hypothetical protein O7602_00680 [Micromonospora sp. WMMD1128]|uniref:hypothetical protein n=1 Tax=unclassified Micromonospora TaxID=2617518 RepID=UPI00248BEA0F|nr:MULTISPECIES: hypothetical protein [unclassified Micromonospora]WBB74113.1 hypothetical protein O7602_00680 [Micromonospora sp. WMMD1128]WFE32499.1 hypothetical protein O7613_23415 [Micromonospora sp. WMMD975]